MEDAPARSQAPRGGISGAEAAKESGDHGLESGRRRQPGEPHPELATELLKLGEPPSARQIRARVRLTIDVAYGAERGGEPLALRNSR